MMMLLLPRREGRGRDSKCANNFSSPNHHAAVDILRRRRTISSAGVPLSQLAPCATGQ